MKLLIVEDDRKTGEYLRQGLSEAGYSVHPMRDGRDGLHLATDGDYDLATPWPCPSSPPRR
jgi:two-component system copper resistance phosphate regulon response regulator CusR